MNEKEKVYWLADVDEDKLYILSTWYRCPGIQDFVERVEADNKVIVGVVFEGNNLGFVLEEVQ